MFKSYKILFTNTLIFGTMMSISSYSWFSMWMGLEINLLSIIPLLTSSNNIYPSESAIKYFITQAMASSALLFVIVMMYKQEFSPQDSIYQMMIMNSALLTKTGAAPFHAWFPEVMEGLSWMNSLIMLTWQKIAPMVLLMYNLNTTQFLGSIIILSSMIGGLSGLNQVSLRKIMAYSSINHIGWMIASALSFKTIWIIYFVVYSLISINIILIFNQLNSFQMNQLINSMNFNKMVKFLFIMNFLSLGGLPPFLGFLPKWLTINNLIMNQFFMISLILIISTLITLFFYIRMTFSTMVISSSETLTTKTMTNSFLMMSMNFISLAGLMLATLLISIN